MGIRRYRSRLCAWSCRCPSHQLSQPLPPRRIRLGHELVRSKESREAEDAVMRTTTLTLSCWVGVFTAMEMEPTL